LLLKVPFEAVRILISPFDSCIDKRNLVSSSVAQNRSPCDLPDVGSPDQQMRL
jgi:hypothetical protein